MKLDACFPDQTWLFVYFMNYSASAHHVLVEINKWNSWIVEEQIFFFISGYHKIVNHYWIPRLLYNML